MRIFWIKAFFLLFFLLILMRLFYWQIIRGEFLQAQAEDQYFTDTKVAAVRGNIVSSDNSILASSNPSFLLYGLPKVIPQDQKVNVAYSLAKILEKDLLPVDSLAKDFIDKMSQDLFWVALKK